MKAKLIKIIQETPDVKTFRLMPEKRLEYIPGQFIMVNAQFPDKEGILKKIKRPYSIATPPLKDYFEITLNLTPNGRMSGYLFGLKEGQILEIEGPYGFFTWDESKSERLIAIAGGTGIAPLMCMIRHAMENGFKGKVILVYSVRKPENIIFRKELGKLAKKNKNFGFFVTITRPEGSRWAGPKGRISEGFLKRSIRNFGLGLFFLCGPPGMIEETVKMLRSLGVQEERIRREQWL